MNAQIIRDALNGALGMLDEDEMGQWDLGNEIRAALNEIGKTSAVEITGEPTWNDLMEAMRRAEFGQA